MNTHLYRSRDDRMLAGVAGGLAELWDADPSLVRILWALLVPLTGGIALVVYIVDGDRRPRGGRRPALGALIRRRRPRRAAHRTSRRPAALPRRRRPRVVACPPMSGGGHGSRLVRRDGPPGARPAPRDGPGAAARAGPGRSSSACSSSWSVPGISSASSSRRSIGTRSGRCPSSGWASSSCSSRSGREATRTAWAERREAVRHEDPSRVPHRRGLADRARPGLPGPPVARTSIGERPGRCS